MVYKLNFSTSEEESRFTDVQLSKAGNILRSCNQLGERTRIPVTTSRGIARAMARERRVKVKSHRTHRQSRGFGYDGRPLRGH